ncbi:MAG: response regulator [Candidatus Wallbacteria bacterium]|nr:response regulator [Candidatus Wallbacteria bacterium]
MRNKTFTTFDISKLLEVYPSTVSRWINEGKLKAFNTPGGHNRVLIKDFLAFLKEFNMPIPESLQLEKEIKILVVDDDETVLKVIKRVLETSGYSIYLAKDGFQAGAAINDFEPQLVILDIMLPGIDGFAVCKEIKEKCKKIKILGITGCYTEEIKKEMTASGADDLLEKPFSSEDLINKIESLLNNENSTPDSLSNEKEIKILVVDDDEAVLKVIKNTLEQCSYNLNLAKDGFQAGKAIGDYEPHLVILDIMLPGINGFDVCKMIKEKHKKTLVLGITGHYTEEIRKKMMACGAEDLLAKPFDTHDLVKKVSSLLKSSR